ncbi:MAG: helix-turn-helix transcriptional regulator [Solirubrobacterales bacterium]|nr:helix-turn-helix transcriptional regulator [Solirubrobacterales bacterium]
MLTDIGADAFAERARRELLATGETVRKRTLEAVDELTPQELQIARLAADRQTNPEIAAQLFLSPRTVEWHLHKVFSKLGISSRRELRSSLSDIGHPPSAASSQSGPGISSVTATGTGASRSGDPG